MNQRGPVLLVIGSALLLGVALVVLSGRGPVADHSDLVSYWRAEDPGCPNDLTPAYVQAGIELSAGWLLANQLPNGPFVDSRDWKTGESSEAVDPGRQATALWALARLNRSQPAEATRDSVSRGLDYWRQVGVDDAEAAAVLALAATDLLSDPDLEDADQLRAFRDELLSRIEGARTKNHRTRRTLGDPEAKASAVSDAAAWAALVHAAVEGRDDLVEASKPVWRATWMHDVDRPTKKRRDPLPTKETFPWAPLALAQLANSGWLDTQDAGPQLAALGVWMIDDHQTLRRSGNTAYAAVGLAVAATWARSVDHEHAAKLSCATDRSLARLLSWQAGHPLAIEALTGAPEQPHISGGVQTAADDPLQRVDYAGYVLGALLEWSR